MDELSAGQPRAANIVDNGQLTLPAIKPDGPYKLPLRSIES